MAEQGQNQFNSQADRAALALRGNLQQSGAQIADSQSVEVDANGNPPTPPPPDGSYARIAHDAAQRSAQQMQRPELGDQPPAGTVDNAVDGSVAPPVTQAQPQPGTNEDQLSSNAQARFATLSTQLRTKDQELQTALTQLESRNTGYEEMKAKLGALEQAHNEMIANNLDSLDPETRAAVMADARMSEMVAGVEQRLMNTLMPHLQGLEQNQVQTEMMRLADKYPAFDIQIHGTLIDMFRGKNPSCTVEQAYRAIAEDDSELVTRSAAASIPPVVQPGNGAAVPRYIPEPQGAQPSTEDVMREDAARFAELMRSDNPNDHKAGLRMADQNISDRLFGS